METEISLRYLLDDSFIAAEETGEFARAGRRQHRRRKKEKDKRKVTVTTKTRIKREKVSLEIKEARGRQGIKREKKKRNKN